MVTRTASVVEKVLQVNIRLSEGGAAGVARTLADGLRDRGIGGRFVYGYGRRGGDSPLHHAYSGLRLASAPVAAVNRALFPVLGRETRLRSRSMWSEFREVVRESDVVHLHAVHSYMANAEDLVSVLLEEEKPVVWTMHDQWHFTGRCAQPAGCRFYLNECDRCPNMAAYQPGLIDRAKTEWPKRRALVELLETTTRFALVPCAQWLREKALETSLPSGRAISNAVDPTFWEAASSMSRARTSPSGRVKAIFLSRDLRDPVKINWVLLRQLSERTDVDLTIVGDNPPHRLEGVQYFPAIRDRAQLAKILTEHDTLVFTSQVDYFPLTLVEAVVARMAIVALDSLAAREFRDYPGLMISQEVSEMPDQIAASKLPEIKFSDTSVQNFAPRRMVDNYMRLYQELVNDEL